ncbi:TonB-dependent receptor [Sphingobium subterraneum]|uniref:Iron complex outermembrane receptor protein n=1 Tax=Sphingobium subterraneum TaxID=627688 RepID=A0A841J017_9SPHN|nr:TonB-dependent receptor [Sphingobium subterraneum]MBB6123702.1 iron complex outermembrane receptor protein [Sphingobium subterraneum]
MKRSAFLIGTALALCPAQTFAQTPAANDNGDGRLDEIVVTAQRRSENLQKVPIAVSSFDAAKLERSGVTSTSGLASVTAGLVFNQSVGLGSPFLRGIGTSGNGPGTENSIAIYVDGVYIGTKSSAVSDVENAARIEVLKGPQGTLFGRNATGGLIQIITKDPPKKPEAMARVGYGNFDTVVATAYLGAPLGEKVAADVSVKYQNQGKGWGTNLNTGKDIGLTNKFNVRGKLKFDLDDATSMVLAGDHSWYRSSVGTGFRVEEGLRTSVDGNLFPANGGRYDINTTIEPYIRTTSNGVSLKIDHELGFADIQSISAYQKSHYFLQVDNDYTPLPFLVTSADTYEHQLSQELKLSSKAGGSFQWTLGVYGFTYKGTQDFGAYGTSRGANRADTIGIQKVRSEAIYGQVTQKLGEATRITAGLRYTWENRRIAGERRSTTPAGVVTVTAFSPPPSANFNKLTWRASIDHDLAQDVLAYASYNRGFKSGTFNVNALQRDPVKPEVLDAYEVGLKSSLFDRRLRLNAAGFYYSYKNIQFSQTFNGISALRNAAKARLYGIDLDAELAVSSQLTLTAGAEWLDTKINSFVGDTQLTPLPGGGNLTFIGDSSGNKLQNSPKYSANAAIDYRVPVGPNTLAFNVNYSYNDGFYTASNNFVRQGAYSLVNARVQLGLNEDHVRLQLWGKNLTNKFYRAAYGGQATGTNYTPAEPRTYGVTAEFRF